MAIRPHPTKGPGHWYIRISHGRGKKEEYIPFAGSKEEAKEYEIAIRSQYKQQINTTFPTFNEVVPRFMTEYKIDHQPAGVRRTIRSFEHLTRFFGSYQLMSINANVIELYKGERLQHPATKYSTDTIKPSTINKELAALSALLKWAAERGYCQPIKVKRFPAKLAKAPIPEIPSEETVLKLLEITKWPKQGLVACLFFAGLRSGEARRLSVETVFLDKKVMVVTGKGNKQRIVPIRPELEEILKRRIEEVKTGYLWLNPRTGKLRPDIRMDTECEALQIKKIKPHDLRHCFGSFATKAGVGLRALQTIMGHSSPVVTEIYSHINAQDLINEIGKM